MIIKNIKIATLSLLIVTLAGCTGMNGDFECNAKAGDACMPVSIVNGQANAGKYNFTQSRGQSDAHTFSYTAKNGGSGSGYTGSTPSPGEPVRYAETVQRIWIAPYQDFNNNYHEPSYVYTVLKRPHWMGVPSHEVKDLS